MISLKQVSKKFRLYNRPYDRFLEWMHLGVHHEEFWALRKMDLEIPRGRTVGIIGANGAGKSTLLKLITGTLLPTEGVIEISGRIAALLELGTGFHPEFSGRQNIAINGQLLGLNHEETQKLEPEIIAFSELGPFIDQPIRTYSSGMIMRLGFSIAAATNPEILIVDEALSVGDARFSQKCIRRIREFRDAGTTILFVSHDPAAVTMLCDEAVLLQRGVVRSIGAPKDVLEEYNALLAQTGEGNVEMKITRVGHESNERAARRHGTFQAVISKLELTDGAGRPTDVFHPGEMMHLTVRVDFLTDVKEPSVGFLIKDRLGLDIFGTNTTLRESEIGPRRAGESAEIEVEVPLNLGYGDYSITVAVHEDETHLEACYEWADNAAIFKVRHREKPWWTGVAVLDPKITVKHLAGEENMELGATLAERFSQLEDPLPLRIDPPSPFLHGFREVEEDEIGSFRTFESIGRFVFTPSNEYIQIKAKAVAVDTPLEVALRHHACGGLGALSLDGGGGVLSWQLPERVQGQPGVYELTVRPVAQDDKSIITLAIYEISTVGEVEETPPWPATTPSK